MSEENPKQSKKRTALLMEYSNSNFRTSVSEKLLHLLGDFNYSSDSIRVLTDYVIVLVSNGKNQSEAKAELEPFLGDTTADFVSWLWGILSETSNDLNAKMSSSYLDNISGASSTEPDADADEQHAQHKKVHERNVPFRLSQETNVGGRRLFSKATGAIFLQKGNTRTTYGNVWDRLDKLTEHDTSLNVKKVNANEGYNIHRQTLEQNSQGLGQSTLMPTVQNSRVNQNLSKNYFMKSFRTNGGQKRHLIDLIPISNCTLDSVDHGKENSRKFRRQSKKYTYMLKESGASCKSERSESYNKSCMSGFDASVSSLSQKICQEKLSMKSLESTQTLISHGGGAHQAAPGRIGPLQAQLVDMRLKLRQLETQISKLQSSVDKDGHHALSSSFGSVDLLKEGVESRTVYVSNIDVAATQDALRSYFSRCGAIIRVINLVKTSIKQKWSAYITFTTKESVGKALELNGSIFFSRIIWVRKAGKMAVKCRNAAHWQSHNSTEIPEDVDAELSTSDGCMVSGN